MGTLKIVWDRTYSNPLQNSTKAVRGRTSLLQKYTTPAQTKYTMMLRCVS
jgi:hypothetical protein